MLWIHDPIVEKTELSYKQFNSDALGMSLQDFILLLSSFFCSLLASALFLLFKKAYLIFVIDF